MKTCRKKSGKHFGMIKSLFFQLIRHQPPFNMLKSILLSILSGCLLGIPFLEPTYYSLSWFALVPLLIAVNNRGLIVTYFLSFISGVILSINVGHWLTNYLEIAHQTSGIRSSALALLFWFYTAQQVAIPLVLFQWLTNRYATPTLLSFPTLIGLFSQFYPNLFPTDLAQSQGLFTVAIQATDMFGVQGLNMIMALCNIIIYRMIQSVECHQTLSQHWPIAFLLAWFSYGFISLERFDERTNESTSPNKTIKFGLVQPNELPRWEPSRRYLGYGLSFPPEMEMTQQLVKSGVDFVIWPEGMNKGYLDNSAVKEAYQNQIADLNTPLIFQDIQHQRFSLSNKLADRKNILIYLNEHGEEAGQYQKIKRVPFGEYIPVIESFLSENNYRKSIDQLESIFSTRFDFISAGEYFTTFQNSDIDIIPLICYETTDGSFVAQVVNEYFSSSAERQQPAIFIALSNDGWFESSTLSNHHITNSILRAVENRVPLVHASNNGPSMIVTASGKVVAKTPHDTAGGFITELTYPKPTSPTIYNRYPWLSTLILTLLCLVNFMMLFKQRTPQIPKTSFK